jgi:hypothetical protein
MIRLKIQKPLYLVVWAKTAPMPNKFPLQARLSLR